MREAARGSLSVSEEGIVSMPFSVSVVGNQTRSQRVVKMTLFFTVNYAGQLKTTGAQ